ncbi:uncharacterized protein [Haliotis cracherodii]|uniref:uncharacterized protein n=1 Tax=Haliotis cracherodii TaxID=6455 RepID=UPI0039EA2989
MFPLVYALLPDNKQTTYQRLFHILKQKASLWNLQLQPLTDFKTAAQNAARLEFPSQIKGCMFHYRQAIWKGTLRLGLQADFHINPSVNHLIRRVAALPLLRLCHFEDLDECHRRH